MDKKVAIMQPYFLPYIGYWQLIDMVDTFIVYDNIEFTKKGWFNRNRILEAGHDRLFTLPLKKDSDYLDVNQRYLSDSSEKEILRTLRFIENSYKRAPYFKETYAVIEKCFLHPNKNLFGYIHNSIETICDYLNIKTNIIISSTVPIDHSLKSEKKVLALCGAQNAKTYVNTIGGRELYSKDMFKSHGINLKFLQTKKIEYPQFKDPFVPWLSIVDVMMFNDRHKIKQMLKEYELV